MQSIQVTAINVIVQAVYKLGIIIMILMLSFTVTNAQITGKLGGNNISDNQKIVSDTTGFAKQREDNTVVIYYKNKVRERNYYDTLIDNMHQLGLLNIWDLDLGNTGSAYQSLKADVVLPVNYSLLPNAQNNYQYGMTMLRLFNTTKPFSEVRYSMGSGAEQVMELFHTQNIKPHWNFSTAYRKINTQGFYKVQKNNIDNFEFITHYQSPNQNYNIRGAFYYNKIQQDENYGIAADSLLGLLNFRRELIPVNIDVASGISRSPVLNYNRSVHGSIVQAYSLGKKTISYNADSIKMVSFKPYLTFENEIYTRNERYCFQHNSPDSIFKAKYFNFNYGIDNEDTLVLRYDNAILGTQLSAEGNVYLNKKIFSAKGGLGIEYQNIGGTATNKQAVNNFIFGEITNRKSVDSNWKWDANVKLYYTGMARGNLMFNGNLSKRISEKLGTISIEGTQYVQQPFYVSESLQINNSEYINTFGLQSNTRLGGAYTNPNWKLKAGVYNLLYGNLIYSVGLQPEFRQWKSLINVVQVAINKEFIFKQWTISNDLLYQLTAKNNPIQLPMWSSFHRFAYKSLLFKKKLSVQTGLDLQFSSNYYIDAYQPVFQSFVPQFTHLQRVAPRLHPFFNFKIKRFRAAVSLNQFQHYFLKNNYNFINHPVQNPTFRFGLSWIFIN